MGNLTTTQILQSLESLYLEGQFQKAVDYLIEHKTSLDEGHFHFNLGTIYGKMEQHAIGRFHLEKAIKKGYINSQSLNNLKAVEGKLLIEDVSNSDSFYERSVSSAMVYPTEIYLLLTLILVFITGMLIRLKVVKSFGAKFSIFAISFIPIIGFYFILSPLQFAISLEDISIMEGPSQIYEEKASLKAGSKIVVDKQSGDWFFIKLPAHKSGWIKRKSLGFL